MPHANLLFISENESTNENEIHENRNEEPQVCPVNIKIEKYENKTLNIFENSCLI